MKNNTNIRRVIFALLLTLPIAGAAFIVSQAFAQTRDRIKYNAVYDCGEGKLKVKVFSCDGASRDATCEVLYVNKYSPGGGSRSQLERSFIEDNYIKQCPVEGGNPTEEQAPPTQNKQPEDNRTMQNKETAQADTASCQPSDKTDESQSGIFKQLIIDRYAHNPESNRDKTITVAFQTFKLGATHKWRPGIGGESPDGPGGRAGTTIYPVKALHTVCSDFPGYKPTGYRGEVQKQQNDNTFYCFKNEVGEWQCNLAQGKNGEIKFFPK